MALHPVGILTSVAFVARNMGDGGGCRALPVVASVTASGGGGVSPCTLPSSSLMCSVVTATNAYGLTSARVKSNGVTLCASDGSAIAGVVQERAREGAADPDPSLSQPPPPQQLLDGDIDYSSSLELPITWSDFFSHCVPFEIYNVTLSQQQQLGAAAVWVPIAQTQVSPSGGNGTTANSLAALFTLPADGKYRAEVCARDGIGAAPPVCATSDGIVVDTSAPATAPTLCVRSIADGELACSSGSSTSTSMSNSTVPQFLPMRNETFLRWSGCSDPQTGIGSFRVVLGSDRAAGYDVGLATRFALTPEMISSAQSNLQTFYVDCFNKAGGMASTSLGPIGFDDSPPMFAPGAFTSSAAAAYEGTAYASSANVTVSFDGSKVTDDVSGVAELLLTVHAQAQVVSGQDSSLQLLLSDEPLSLSSITHRTFNLEELRGAVATAPPRLHVRLTAVNRAGLRTQIGMPMPLSYDDARPVLQVSFADALSVVSREGQAVTRLLGPNVIDGDAPLYVLLPKGSFYARSGIGELEVDVSAQFYQGTPYPVGTTQRVPYNASGPTAITGISLPCDRRLRVSVRAVSGAGQASTESVEATVDKVCSRPTRGSLLLGGAYVQHGPTVSCVQVAEGLSVLHAAWQGFGTYGVTAGALQVGYSLGGLSKSAPDSPLSTNDGPGRLGPTSGFTSIASREGNVALQVSDLPHAPQAFNVSFRACSSADLCTDASGTFKLVETAPAAGRVRLHQDQSTPGFLQRSLLTHATMLRGTWQDFTDVSGEPLTYEVCVGTSAYGCQALPFTSVASGATSWTADAGLPLQCGASYHLAVRATNCAGMQHVVASPGAKLCCNKPSEGRVQLLTPEGDVAAQHLSTVAGLRVAWSGFTEMCSGIRSYTVHMQVFNQSQILWTSSDLTNSTSSVELPASSLDAQLTQSGQYVLVVVATSHAGLAGQAFATLSIDRTPPTGLAVAASWQGQLAAVASLASADCMPASSEKVTLSWAAATDPESGIQSFSLGSLDLSIDGASPSWTDLGSLRSVVWPIANGTLTAFAVRACNTAGLCGTSAWSHGLSRVTTWPSADDVSLTPSAGASAGFLGGADVILSGAWTSLAGSAFTYEVCVGTSAYGCQALPFTSVASGAMSWTADAGLVLQCGASYHLAVRATNCAGMQRVVASPGAKLCCNKPSEGRVQLLTPEGDVAAQHLSTVAGLRVAWSGFTETCSGIRSYTVKMVIASGEDDDQQAQVVWSHSLNQSTASELALPAPSLDAQLTQSTKYRVVVSATSHAGHTSAASASFVVDLSPPTIASLTDGFDSTFDLVCLPATASVGCTWSGVEDPESGVSAVEWALGSAPLKSDLAPFAVSRSSSAQVNAATGLAAGAHVYCTLRVTNGAGVAITKSSNGVRLVEPSCDLEDSVVNVCALPLGNLSLPG